MEVVSARSALLSNYEVLTLLRELESEHLSRQKTAIRIKKEEEERALSGDIQDPASVGLLPQDETCENLRTVEFEAIQYLSADFQPSKSQSAEAITQLVKNLRHYDLTKAEKLQVVNLAPVEPVEIYVIIEEIEDRFGDRMDDLLGIVRNSMTADVATKAGDYDVVENEGTTMVVDAAEVFREGWDDGDDDGVEDVFDDMGAGAGIEGDLEVEDD